MKVTGASSDSSNVDSYKSKREIGMGRSMNQKSKPLPSRRRDNQTCSSEEEINGSCAKSPNGGRKARSCMDEELMNMSGNTDSTEVKLEETVRLTEAVWFIFRSLFLGSAIRKIFKILFFSFIFGYVFKWAIGLFCAAPATEAIICFLFALERKGVLCPLTDDDLPFAYQGMVGRITSESFAKPDIGHFQFGGHILILLSLWRGFIKLICWLCVKFGFTPTNLKRKIIEDRKKRK